VRCFKVEHCAWILHAACRCCWRRLSSAPDTVYSIEGGRRRKEFWIEKLRVGNMWHYPRRGPHIKLIVTIHCSLQKRPTCSYSGFITPLLIKNPFSSSFSKRIVIPCQNTHLHTCQYLPLCASPLSSTSPSSFLRSQLGLPHFPDNPTQILSQWK